MSTCIICNARRAYIARIIVGVKYFMCEGCGSIFADREAIDNGRGGSRNYDNEYWESEVAAARERCYGSSAIRVAETYLYARRKIDRFIDISSGSGLLLDAMAILNSGIADRMIGIEPFPPPLAWRSSHKNYKVGFLRDIDVKVDAGVCIEVIEHLWPDTLEKLVYDLSNISHDGALFYFNSAQPSFVLENDFSYMSPFELGHVVSYSLTALNDIFIKFGFTVIPLPGRDWAFLAEYNGELAVGANELYDRLWSPVKNNLEMLRGGQFGEMLYTSGVEAARCYLECALRSRTV